MLDPILSSVLVTFLGSYLTLLRRCNLVLLLFDLELELTGA